MTIEGVILFASITIFSLVLLIISLLSYWKYGKLRRLFISIILFMFFTRSVLLSLGLFYQQVEAFTSSIYIWVFDLAILAVLYVASLKK
jgi:hypothetical protein